MNRIILLWGALLGTCMCVCAHPGHGEAESSVPHLLEHAAIGATVCAVVVTGLLMARGTVRRRQAQARRK